MFTITPTDPNYDIFWRLAKFSCRAALIHKIHFSFIKIDPPLVYSVSEVLLNAIRDQSRLLTSSTLMMLKAAVPLYYTRYRNEPNNLEYGLKLSILCNNDNKHWRAFYPCQLHHCCITFLFPFVGFIAFATIWKSIIRNMLVWKFAIKTFNFYHCHWKHFFI